jgi:hypothetical protein
MASMMWDPSAEVLDPPAVLRSEDGRRDATEVAVDRSDDAAEGIDWDDPESWYDEGGSD